MGIFSRKSSPAPSAARTPPASTAEADHFTALGEAAAANPTSKAMQEYWAAVYGLDKWWFLPHLRPGETMLDHIAAGTQASPLVTRMDDRIIVVAFTSEQRALRAARDNKLGDDQTGFPLLSMSRDAAVKMLCLLPDEIFGVIFNRNRGEQGAFAPMDNVAAMYEFHLGSIPEGGFDRFVRAVKSSGSEAARHRLMLQLMAMQHWYFITEKERPNIPLAISTENGAVPAVFTDTRRAVAGAATLGVTGAEEQPTLISATPMEAVEYIQTMSEYKGHGSPEVAFNYGTLPFVIEISAMVQAKSSPASKGLIS